MRYSEIIEGRNDEPPFKKPKGVTTPVFTKDGRPIKMSKSYMGVTAYIGGVEAGTMDIRCEYYGGEYKNTFWVKRIWVNEEFRGQGVATAMYDYAFRAGFRPLNKSDVQTDGGRGVWTKHIERKLALGMGQERHADYPNRFHWRPLPPENVTESAQNWIMDGNKPMVVYHSTRQPWETVESGETYFAKDKSEAMSYGHYVYEANIWMNNPHVTDDLDEFAECVHNLGEYKNAGYDGIVFGDQFVVFNAQRQMRLLTPLEDYIDA